MRATLQERFNKKYEVVPFCGCWIWTGALSPHRYGTIEANKKTAYAHRVSYEIHRGPIAKGLVIDHLCKVPECVNPSHLEVVTQSQNVRRGDLASVTREKGLALTHCKWGHEYTPENTAVYSHGRTCRTCNILRHRVRRLNAKG